MSRHVNNNKTWRIQGLDKDESNSRIFVQIIFHSKLYQLLNEVHCHTFPFTFKYLRFLCK